MNIVVDLLVGALIGVGTIIGVCAVLFGYAYAMQSAGTLLGAVMARRNATLKQLDAVTLAVVIVVPAVLSASGIIAMSVTGNFHPIFAAIFVLGGFTVGVHLFTAFRETAQAEFSHKTGQFSPC